jgi:hypothetical protein
MRTRIKKPKQIPATQINANSIGSATRFPILIRTPCLVLEVWPLLQFLLKLLHVEGGGELPVDETGLLVPARLNTAL